MPDRDLHPVRHPVCRGTRLLVVSFATAIGLVAILALIARATGMITPAMVAALRPQTDFIWHPDQWTLVVAVVAGTAGVLALSTDKGAAMVGVFISVTTVTLGLLLIGWLARERRRAKQAPADSAASGA